MPINWCLLIKKMNTKRRLYRKLKPEEVAALPGITYNANNTPDGYEDITYRVDIDYEDVAEMARKAAGNARQESRSGPVRVVIVNREQHRESGKVA